MTGPPTEMALSSGFGSRTPNTKNSGTRNSMTKVKRSQNCSLLPSGHKLPMNVPSGREIAKYKIELVPMLTANARASHSRVFIKPPIHFFSLVGVREFDFSFVQVSEHVSYDEAVHCADRVRNEGAKKG